MSMSLLPSPVSLTLLCYNSFPGSSPASRNLKSAANPRLPSLALLTPSSLPLIFYVSLSHGVDIHLCTDGSSVHLQTWPPQSVTPLSTPAWAAVSASPPPVPIIPPPHQHLLRRPSFCFVVPFFHGDGYLLIYNRSVPCRCSIHHVVRGILNILPACPFSLLLSALATASPQTNYSDGSLRVLSLNSPTNLPYSHCSINFSYLTLV